MISSPVAIVMEAVPLACLGLAAVTDLRHRIVPNLLVLAVVICGLALRSFDGLEMFALSVLVCAAVVFLVGLLACYKLMGWGDVKLIGAVTLLVPLRDSGNLLLAIFVAGGVLSCCYLLAQAILRKQANVAQPHILTARTGFAGFLDREHGRILESPSMPYAVAVLAGVFCETAFETVRCWPAILSWQ